MNRVMNGGNAERLMAYKRKEAMEKAKKDTANNPINSYTHGFADGYSKGFIDAIELLMRNEEIWKKEINYEEENKKFINDLLGKGGK